MKYHKTAHYSDKFFFPLSIPLKSRAASGWVEEHFKTKF